MSWTELTADWPRAYLLLKARFPNIDPSRATLAKDARPSFEAYLADRHDLTHRETREILDDMIQLTVARQAHRAALQAA